MHRFDQYAERPVRFLEPWSGGGWRMKVYGIAYGRAGPEPPLVDAALRVAAEHLPRPAVTANRYGVGFVGVHQGRGANVVFVDWWEDQNELHHRVFLSRPDAPVVLREAPPGGITACVYDVAVIAFERDAWVREVLAADEPSLERYLAARLEGEV